jgi:hypothetical protein
MKALMAVLFGVLLLVSCGIVASSNIIPQGRYRITREMCLTREAYYPSAYPCGLSQYKYVGKGSNIVQRVGMIPKGGIVTVERSHRRTDLYAPDTIQFQGKVVFNGELIGYNAEFTHEQFSKWFSKID